MINRNVLGHVCGCIASVLLWSDIVIMSQVWCFIFFFQAEDGIRDLVRSRGLGDVYKRQVYGQWLRSQSNVGVFAFFTASPISPFPIPTPSIMLSLIHI